ncbi:ABC transporter ATP-binding protein [Pseudomonas typographi]|uniref:ABC transporter ATP-binding protein n=1 Tax=Pseudomonas typographi TaxID=2715964 RepID=A0ABR7YZX6_9PSED|nr:ABC transporter ATP-binding protein [Pseudomonas typographi]MBD1550582.1 ABC transporter ATP-binding protein [Pseudomonas typographi]MBD1586833.1 ABC transporter ATP-binding protein [Pseudomonas typographi]MBD1598727.1 ABC transporter ATP-binding protein [Pseudomonas typographi]
MTAIAPPIPPLALDTPGALSIRGLNKHYPIDGRRLPVLQHIDLQVQPGEFIAIVGASGCGKSTLLRLIAGLETDYEGQMQLDGKPIRGPSLDRGMVFQDHRLFPWKTVFDNIALALKHSRLDKAHVAARVNEHIALVGLQGFEHAYPHQLSGGMAQRAAIARALITQPKLLLLDEPFGALDALTRVRMQQELQRLWIQQRSTMIMVTHDVEEALYLGDRVIVLEPRPGRIRHVIEVGLAHPRERNAARLQSLRQEILGQLLSQAGH